MKRQGGGVMYAISKHVLQAGVSENVNIETNYEALDEARR